MEIQLGMQNDIVTLKLSGDLTAATAEKLRTEINQLAEKKFFFIVVNMDQVGFMDSSGLNACIASHRLTCQHHGLIIFAQPSQTVQHIFNITNSQQILTISESASDALKTALLKKNAFDRRTS